MGNPNFLGSYLVLLIPIAMHLFIVKSKKYASAIFCALLYCLLCTMTRGAWLGRSPQWLHILFFYGLFVTNIIVS